MVDVTRFEETFKIVDIDNDGLITAEEMRSVLRAMGEEITPERAVEIVAAIDKDGDGRISLEEFATFMS
jgi:Ca2+-binding EF-hand superfamily protein